MLNHFINDAEHIYLALGATDFRKQIHSLVHWYSFPLERIPLKKLPSFFSVIKEKIPSKYYVLIEMVLCLPKKSCWKK